MKLSLYPRSAIAAATFLASLAALAGAKELGEFSLSHEMMKVSYEAVRLSNLSYADVEQDSGCFGEQQTMEHTTDEFYESTAVLTPFSHPDYDQYHYIHFYTQEPDQALVAKSMDNKCYVAFRGTNVDFNDWLQNINQNIRVVHRNNDTSLEGCEVREGFVDFLDSDAILYGLRDVVECLNSISCDDSKGPCLVITGHSQGGASAAVASVLLYGLNPTVATFGQPPTFLEGCESIPSERYYRYINSIKEPDEDDDVAFDPVVFAFSLSAGATQYGHAILLGEDTGAVKYLGMDEDGADFKPLLVDRQNELAAHLLGENKITNYDWKMGVLLNNYPTATDGFSDGAFCDRSYPELCASGGCSTDNVCTNTTASGSVISVTFPFAMAFLSSFLFIW